MLLGFKKRFVSKIEDGSKIHTLRNTPKRMPKEGEILHMYTGLRTNNCQFITKEHTLISMQKVEIFFMWIDSENRHTVSISIDSRILDVRYKSEFYINDGFEDEKDFVSFWKQLKKGESPQFTGPLIHWTDFKY